MDTNRAHNTMKEPGTVRVGFAEPVGVTDGELSDEQLATVVGGSTWQDYPGIVWDTYWATVGQVWDASLNWIDSVLAPPDPGLNPCYVSTQYPDGTWALQCDDGEYWIH